jgi:Cu/Zn superoxide dismutase
MRTVMVLLAALAAGSVLVFSAADAARKPVTKTFHVALTGESEDPAADPVATGTATIKVRSDGRVCYQIAAKNLPRAVAAHIHKGKAGVSGNVVVALKTPNAAGNAKGCRKASKKLARTMMKSPGAFYVNVHTAEFPNGAIRGQLKGSSTKTFGTTVKRTLVGTSEPNATGTAVVRFRPDDGLVCYRLTVANITLPAFAAHIHKGAAGVNGNVVVPFTAPGANGTSDGCVAADKSLIDQILGDLSGYYVNVHTTEHKGGAIRAQLA